MKQKLYFRNIDDTFCQPLQPLLDEAKFDGLKNLTLIEAVPDNNNPDFIWCSHYGDCVERQDCVKSYCTHYESKSGRGVCSNRGHLYQHGEEVNFKITK